MVDLHAEPKGSHPRPVGKACWHLGSGKQVEKRDREVGSVINAWGLLGSGLKGIDRNRRVSSSLSPIFYLFLIPSGIWYQKVQHLLTEEETPEGSHPPVMKHQQPGPKYPGYGIPAAEWPTVVHRVAELKEPLRIVVATAYGVSHETIRRIILHLQKQDGPQEM